VGGLAASVATIARLAGDHHLWSAVLGVAGCVLLVAAWVVWR
jgi:hypothetical protein